MAKINIALSVVPIKAFDDNYIWCIQSQTHCIVVDPGDAAPVFAHLKQNNLTLSAIIITHHHWDHTSGLDQLLSATPDIPVYGPTNPEIKQITYRVTEQEQIHIPQLDLNLKVLEVPGHTLDHIAYFSDIGLFCGDTLFSAGCGRLFEGTPKQMYQSLTKLTALPAETMVYCTHEYTLANMAFAEAVDANNPNIQIEKSWAKQQTEQGLPSLPTNIAKELKINPFLRCDQESIKISARQYSGQALATNSAVFAALRQWKDKF